MLAPRVRAGAARDALSIISCEKDRIGEQDSHQQGKGGKTGSTAGIAGHDAGSAVQDGKWN